MRFSVIFASLVAVIPAFAAPTSLLTVQRAEGASSGRLIVRLKDTASKTTHLKWLNQLAGSNVSITHQWSEDFLNGYAGYFDNEALAALQAPPDVASISEDGIMRITATVSQTNAPWGLSRISQNGVVGGSAANTNFVYRFDSSAGAGVDIFVVDTGIFIGHSDFGGRARWGATFGGYPNADGNGHGTHVSGTAAGSRWGVAKVTKRPQSNCCYILIPGLVGQLDRCQSAQ